MQKTQYKNITEDLVANADALLDRVAVYIAQRIAEGLAAHGEVSVIWSGGRTPPKLIPHLAKAEVDWSCVSFVIADERWVSLEDADSNEGEHLRAVRNTPLEQAKTIGLYADHKTPEAAAKERTPVIAEALAAPVAVALLGMGADGHIASLFPGGEWDSAPKEQMILTASEPGTGRARLSLTPSALLRAQETLLLCNDEGKARALERAKAGAAPMELPVALLLKADAPSLRVFLLARESS